MFANTVFTTIYQSIASLFNNKESSHIEALENELSAEKKLTNFLKAENDLLKEENSKFGYWASRYKDFYDQNSDIHHDIEMMERDFACQKVEMENISNELAKENASLKCDLWDLAKAHNQLKNDYDELKKHDGVLNDMLLDGSEPVTGIDSPVSKLAAI